MVGKTQHGEKASIRRYICISVSNIQANKLTSVLKARHYLKFMSLEYSSAGSMPTTLMSRWFCRQYGPESRDI